MTEIHSVPTIHFPNWESLTAMDDIFQLLSLAAQMGHGRTIVHAGWPLLLSDADQSSRVSWQPEINADLSHSTRKYIAKSSKS
jgi:hypothetical protein